MDNIILYKQLKKNIVAKYELDTKGLLILDLTSKKYSILHWVAYLLSRRIYEPISSIGIKAKKYIVDNYYIDIDKYDVIKTYTEYNSNFSYAVEFLNNTISVEQLEKAVKKGGLGTKYVDISIKANKKLRLCNYFEFDYNKYALKDLKSRERYNRLKVNYSDVYIKDLINKENDNEISE